MKLLKFLEKLTKSGILTVEGASMKSEKLSKEDKEILKEIEEIAKKLRAGEELERSKPRVSGGTYQATSASPKPYEDNPEFYDKLIRQII